MFLFSFWTDSTCHRCQAGEVFSKKQCLPLWQAPYAAVLAPQQPQLALTQRGKAPVCWSRSALHLRFPIYLPKAESLRYRIKTPLITFHPEKKKFSQYSWPHFRGRIGFCRVCLLASGRQRAVFQHHKSRLFVMLSNSFILTSANMEKFQNSSTKHFYWTCKCGITNGTYWRHLFGMISL